MTREASVYHGEKCGERQRRPRGGFRGAALLRAATVVALLLSVGPAVAGAVATPADRPPPRRLGEWIIPRGREPLVRALAGAIVASPGGFEFAGGGIEFDRIALSFHRASPPADLTLELLHASARAASDIVVGSVALRAPAGAPASLVAAVRSALASFAERERLWVHQPQAAGTKTGEARLEQSPRWPWWAFGATVGSGVGLTLAVAGLGRWRRRRRRQV